MSVFIAWILASIMPTSPVQAHPRSDHMDRSVALAQVARSLTAAGHACRVSDARYVGRVAGGAVFEAGCIDGPGYLVIDGGRSAAVVSCEEAWAAAFTSPGRAPECTLPGNGGHADRLRRRAREAGVMCRIDQAQPVGRTRDGMLYEIGCDGEDGFLLSGGGDLRAKPCLEATTQGETTGCRFTTRREQIASLQAALPGDGPCTITQFRFMGTGDGGRYHQLACASGEDRILRRSPDGTHSDAPCSESMGMGLSCARPEGQ